MSGNILDGIKTLLKRINSVSLLSVHNNGKTILFIPAWSVALAIALLVIMRKNRRRA
jgi:hypothetical protein